MYVPHKSLRVEEFPRFSFLHKVTVAGRKPDSEHVAAMLVLKAEGPEGHQA